MVARRDRVPHVPLTTDEVARDAWLCNNLGAAILQFRAHFTPGVEAALASGRLRELLEHGPLRFGIRALVLFGLWHSRYASLLRDRDVGAALGAERVSRSTPAFAQAPR